MKKTQQTANYYTMNHQKLIDFLIGFFPMMLITMFFSACFDILTALSYILLIYPLGAFLIVICFLKKKRIFFVLLGLIVSMFIPVLAVIFLYKGML